MEGRAPSMCLLKETSKVSVVPDVVPSKFPGKDKQAKSGSKGNAIVV